jgi:hypothetical protein
LCKIKPSEIEKFEDFPLSKKTQLGLKSGNYEKPTEIQRESIGIALKGFDLLGAAKTGSGKTLAFLIPVKYRFYSPKLRMLPTFLTDNLLSRFWNACTQPNGQNWTGSAFWSYPRPESLRIKHLKC